MQVQPTPATLPARISLTQATKALMQTNTDRWTAGEGSLSTPALSETGVVYSEKGRLVSLDPNGKELWSRELGGEVSSPAIGPQGNVYALAGGQLHALDRQGKPVWSKPFEGLQFGHPAAGPEGNVYAVNSRGRLVCWDASGREVFSSRIKKLLDFDPTPDLYTSPVVGPDGTVLVANKKKYLTAFRPDGGRAWTYRLPGELMTGPSFGQDGSIVLGAFLNTVVKLNAKGKEQWRTDLGFTAISSIPAAGLNGAVLAGDSQGFLYRIGPRGGPPERVAALDSKPMGRPWVEPDGSFTVASWFGTLYHFGPEERTPGWTAELGGMVVTSPQKAEDGTLYVNCAGAGMMALREHADAEEILRQAVAEPEEAQPQIATVGGWVVVGGVRVKVKGRR
ncbi:MAG: PQQ-binding-like beta-propeller repeat protein [Candidatus Eremiobacterota bacterium]